MNLFRKIIQSVPVRKLPTTESQSAKLINEYSKLAKETRADYDNFKLSGHPDEQLELIDYYRDMVNEFKSAEEREFIVNAMTVSKAKASLVWWEENAAYDKNDSRYIEGVANRSRRIEWAQSGLV
jgi:hypothetical protein